jgi:hypothetical protein
MLLGMTWLILSRGDCTSRQRYFGQNDLILYISKVEVYLRRMDQA